MSSELRASTPGMSDATEQTMQPEQLLRLRAHEMEVQLRSSDLQVQLGQLRDQQALAGTKAERVGFNKPIADAQHEITAAMLDFEATRAKIRALEKTEQRSSVTTVEPPPEPLFGKHQLEMTGVGAFLLMIPIVFALSRRIWVRSGPKLKPVFDLESSPRLQRLEEALESVAIEVERIGEAQRFATKLLSERQPEGVINRVSPGAVASSHREPGTITPH